MGAKRRRTPQEKKRLSLERDRRKARRSPVGRANEPKDVVAEKRARRRASKLTLEVEKHPRGLAGEQLRRKSTAVPLKDWLKEREEKKARMAALREWQKKRASERKRRRKTGN